VSCVQAALKAKKLERSLQVPVPAGIAEELLRWAVQAEEEEVTRS
jgi:hypothetical protein